MNPLSYIARVTGLSQASWEPFVRLQQDGEHLTITGWNADKLGVAQPTDAAFQAALLAPEPAATQAALLAYAEAKQIALRDGGIRVNVGTAEAPLFADVATDVEGLSLVTGCVQLIGLASQAGLPAPSYSWVNNDMSTLPLSVAQVMKIALAFGTHVQATYDALATIVDAITNGTITTTSGVDTASWPSTTA